ncbi:MAG: CPBP family glutamic-type intramembrane protease [Acidimicrobiales bacterium]
MRPHQRKAARNSVLFALVVLSAGWIGRLVDEATGAEGDAGIGQLIWIVSPIATAAVLRLWGGDGWGDAGWKPRFRANGGWYAVSLLFYPVVLGVTAGIGLLLDEFLVDGGGSFPFGTFTAAFLVGLVPVLFTAVAEEVGWRGYLVPRLEVTGVGRWVNHLVVGLIWGAWHIPYVAVFWDFTDESLTVLVPRLLVGTVIVAVIYGEIRMATGSVWPAVLMHATGNAVVGALLADGVLDVGSSTPLVFSPGADGLFVIGATVVGASAIVIAARRSSGGRDLAQPGSSPSRLGDGVGPARTLGP